MLVDMLPFLIPVFLIEIALLIFALIDLFKREHIDNNTRIIWAVVIILFGIIGPVIYFIFGRKENPVDID
ncbi:MAG TPA: PLDc_N domain-containing protein [Dehalococcoidia bacterium]|nr:PLDc_N domain-containing protein [Dehalococcoidia bacterium]